MNRREFLGAGAAITLASQVTYGAPAPAKIPCAVLGMGHAHSTDIVKRLLESPDFTLTGVCEPDESMRNKYNDHALLKDVPWLEQDAVLTNPDIRMVAVESDVPRLLDLGRAVVDAGKHLHLDKPAGTDLAEFRALLDSADRQKLLVQMGYMYRYNPGFDFIRKMVSDGALGEIYSIHASMCTDLPQANRDRVNIHPGGLMLELGCHLIDMIVLLLGEPEKVTAFLRHDTPMADTLMDNTLAVLEFKKAMATVETAAKEPNAFAGRRFKVVGTEGAITLLPLEPPAAQLSLRDAWGDHPKGLSEVSFPNLPRHVRDLADLAACIRGAGNFAYPSTHDFAVQRTILRASGESV